MMTYYLYLAHPEFNQLPIDEISVAYSETSVILSLAIKPAEFKKILNAINSEHLNTLSVKHTDARSIISITKPHANAVEILSIITPIKELEFLWHDDRLKNRFSDVFLHPACINSSLNDTNPSTAINLCYGYKTDQNPQKTYCHYPFYLFPSQYSNLSPRIEDLASKKLKNILQNKPPNQKNSWQILSGANLAHQGSYHKTIADTELEVKVTRTFLLTRFIPENTLSPITHMHIGIHEEGVTSIVVFFNATVSQQWLISHDLWQYNVSNKSKDHHLAIGITRHKDQFEDLSNFLNLVHDLNPLHPTIIRLALNYYSLNKILRDHPSLFFLINNRQFSQGRNLPELEELNKDKQFHPQHLSTFTGHQPYVVHFKDEALDWPYVKEHHAITPVEIPNLFLAILALDVDAITAILQQDPDSIYIPAPYGMLPFELAEEIGNQEIIEIMLIEWSKLNPLCKNDKDKRKNGWFWINAEKNRKKYAPEYPPARETSVEQQQKICAKYKALYAQPLPVDSQFHKDLKAGDFLAVKQALEVNHSLLESPDTLGFKPITIAAGHGYDQIVKHLLKQGASIETYENPIMRLRMNLLNDAASNEILRLVLARNPQQEMLSQTLFAAAKQTSKNPSKDNVLKLTTLIRYSIPHHPSMSNDYRRSLERILITLQQRPCESAEFSELQDLLSWYLDYNSDPTVLPTNCSTEQVAGKLSAYNEKLQRQKPFASLKRIYLQNDATFSEFETTNQKFTMKTISTADLSETEMRSIRNIYLLNFSAASEQDYSNESYFAKAFPKDRHENVFVDLCLVDGQIKSFITFKIKTVSHQSQPCCVMDICLGGITRDCPVKNIGHLIFRYPLGRKKQHPDLPLYVISKQVYPGFAWLSTLSNECQAFPKYSWNMDLVKTLFAQMGYGDIDETGMLQRLLKVNPGLQSPSKKIEEYSNLTDGNEDNALGVALNMNLETAIEAYTKVQQKFGINNKGIVDTGDCFERLLNAQQQSQQLRARL